MTNNDDNLNANATRLHTMPVEIKTASMPIGTRQKIMRTLRKYKSSIYGCGVLTLFTAPVHAGFVLVFLLPIFAIWILYSLYVMLTQPERRQHQAGKLFIWLVTLISIVCLHAYYYFSTRHEANTIVAQIDHFTAVQHRCPSSLDEIGISKEELKKRLGLAYYHCTENGVPSLHYAATYIVFNFYIYNFSTKSWTLRED